MKQLLELFRTFFVIGAFTIGGGYAMLPLFEKEFVENKKWFTQDDYMNMVTIATSAPGPLAVNSAVFTGYFRAGFYGSIASVLGVITPPILIMLIIVPLYSSFVDLEIVQGIFKGVRPAIIGLIGATVYKMVKKSKLKGFKTLVPVISFGVIVFLNVDPVFVIIGLGLLGFFRGVE